MWGLGQSVALRSGRIGADGIAGGPVRRGAVRGGGGGDLFGSAYKPEDGTDGGQIIFARLAGSHPVQPVLRRPGHRGERRRRRPGRRLVVLTNDYKYAPDLATDIPTLDNGGVKVPGDSGDAMTVTWKLRDGPQVVGRPALTCDDFKYAWEWVMDPDNIGVVDRRATRTSRPSSARPTPTMVLHFTKIYEGYITLTVAPLPRHYLQDIPVEDQVKGQGFRPTEVAKLAGQRRVQVRVGHAGQPSCASRKNPNYKSFATGKPAHLDTPHLQVVRRRRRDDRRLQGRRVDVATDLQDSDLPKVQDLGDQVSRDPVPHLRVPPPELVRRTRRHDQGPAAARRTRPSPTAATGCPMADPAMREAVAYAVDKNEINTRLLGGAVQVANTNISPGRLVLRGPDPGDVRPREGQVDPRRGRLDAGRRRDPREGRPQGQDRALHDDPPGPPGHARAGRRRGSRTSASRRSSTRSTPANIFADYNESTARHPVRARRTATSTSPSTRSRRRSTRWATTSATTAASSSPIGVNDAQRHRHRTSTRPSTPSRTASTSRSSRTRWPSSSRSTSRRPSRSRSTTASRSTCTRRELGNFFAQPDPGGPELERRRLVRQALDILTTGSRTKHSRSGRPHARLPRALSIPPLAVTSAHPA